VIKEVESVVRQQNRDLVKNAYHISYLWEQERISTKKCNIALFYTVE